MLRIKNLFFLLLLFIPVVSFAQTVNILVVTIHGIDAGNKEWQPTVDYLQQTLPQHEFNLVPVTPIDLPRIKELIARQEIDFVITQPAIYVDLELNFGISRILTMVKAGGLSQFGSTIITHIDSGIRSIDDLHGKVIAGVAELGFGGWLIGYKEMMENGFDPYEDAEDVVFLGTQPNEVQAVHERKADAAVIRTGVLEKLSKEEKIELTDFYVVAEKTLPEFPFKISTSLYPEWALAKTRNASNDLSKAVALALLSLGKNSTVTRNAGFQEWTFPYDYQPVHELLKALRTGPYQDYGKVTADDLVDQYKTEAIIILVSVLLILTMTIIVHRSNIKLSQEKLEKESALNSMKYLATHDNLTGLSNRLLFIELLEKLVHEARRRETSIAVIFIDLDEFKKVNDNYGHSIGDEVLRKIGEFLLESLRVNDIAGRLGGDEFVVALNDVEKIENLHVLANRILSGISKIDVPGVADTHIGASIGVIYGRPGSNGADKLIMLSDLLMYKAKKAGKGRTVLQPILSSSG